MLGHPYSNNVNVYGRFGVTRAKSEGKTTDGTKGDDTVTGWNAARPAKYTPQVVKVGMVAKINH